MIPEGAKVELRPGVEKLYESAVAGSRGTVTKRKTDEYGFPMVYVVWDQNHWKYNNEADGWTFEDHFHLIEMPPEDKCGSCGQPVPDKDDHLAAYADKLMEAFAEASESEAFIVISVKPERRPEHPGKFVYEPRVFISSLTQPALDIVEAQVVHLAAMAHKQVIAERLKGSE